MFCFKLWSDFGVFRDPLTITQNLTFPIPPKTTVGGMLASILGIDYQEYFDDPDYFDFGYSVVLQKPVRKRSFAQNYVADYTTKADRKLKKSIKYGTSTARLEELQKEQTRLEKSDDLSKKEEKKREGMGKKIETAKNNKEKAFDKYNDNLSECFVSPKPIFRELLLSPEYLIFIKDYKYEEKAVSHLKSHLTNYALYMGNSEFSANYEFIESVSSIQEGKHVDSLTTELSAIHFESGKKYTNLHMATKTVGQREYRDYKNIVICDQPIRFTQPREVHSIKTNLGEFSCDFI